MRRTIAVWCVLGCCVWGCLALPGGIALAQEQDQAQDQSQLDEAARLTFESARQAFVAGDYEAALARFRQAYQLSARPGLLYNIAQTLDRLRRDEETVAALREYLEAYDFYFGPDGLITKVAGPYRDFFRPDFHPWDQDNAHLIEAWKARHESAGAGSEAA